MRALTSEKYTVEEDMDLPKQSQKHELIWSYSSVYVLEK